MNEDCACQWGGFFKVKTCDGRVVNVAEELNRLEKEKNDEERRSLEDRILRDLLQSSFTE